MVLNESLGAFGVVAVVVRERGGKAKIDRERPHTKHTDKVWLPRLKE